MNFDEMNGPQLVAAWNEMVLTAIDLKVDAKPVKKFADAATGRERCRRLHALIQHAKSPVEEIECKIDHSAEGSVIKELCRACTPVPKHTGTGSLKEEKQSTAWRSRLPASMSDEEAREVIARQETEKKMKASARLTKLKETQAAKEAKQLADVNEKRTAKGLDPIESLKPVKVEKENVVATKKKAKTNGARKWLDDESVITKLIKENPARPGTKAAKLWDKIRNGMTVGAYKEATKETNYLRWYIGRNQLKVS